MEIDEVPHDPRLEKKDRHETIDPRTSETDDRCKAMAEDNKTQLNNNTEVIKITKAQKPSEAVKRYSDSDMRRQSVSMSTLTWIKAWDIKGIWVEYNNYQMKISW